MPRATRQATGANSGAPQVANGTERALAVLKELARHPAGIALEDLSRRVDAPKSSVHRALAILIRSELAARPAAGQYILGPEFIRLAYAFQEAGTEPRLVGPCLQELADTYGETAHYAELAGHEVVYRAKVTPQRGSVHMTSTVGGRNPAYCTGVGKALLASRVADAPDPADLITEFGPFEPRTEHTLVTVPALLADLRATHERGFALDDQESELGINCIAFPLFRSSPTIASGAISVAALRHRMGLEELRSVAEDIRATIHEHLGRVTR
jgi:IclR family transcriptional regulator, acetate operon repressor